MPLKHFSSDDEDSNPGTQLMNNMTIEAFSDNSIEGVQAIDYDANAKTETVTEVVAEAKQ